MAGLALWGAVVPEPIAYAALAGLPRRAGLYTLLVSLLVSRAVRGSASPVRRPNVGSLGAPRTFPTMEAAVRHVAQPGE
jgi:hypothetical protein